MKENDTFVEWW